MRFRGGISGWLCEEPNPDSGNARNGKAPANGTSGGGKFPRPPEVIERPRQTDDYQPTGEIARWNRAGIDELRPAPHYLEGGLPIRRVA